MGRPPPKLVRLILAALSRARFKGAFIKRRCLFPPVDSGGGQITQAVDTASESLATKLWGAIR